MAAATVVLVHGAWAEPSDWDEVVEGLDARGIRAVTIDSPSARSSSADLDADVAEVRRVLDEIDGPKLLAGWSYGGMVISAAAAGRGDVVRLVYIAAMLPTEGQTAWDITSSAPSVLAEEGFLALHDDGTTSIAAWPDPAAAEIYGERLATIMASRPRRRQSIASSFQPVAAVAWRDIATTYVVTMRDRALSPDLQLRLAAAVDDVIEIDSGHFPMWEATDQLVEVLAART